MGYIRHHTIIVISGGDYTGTALEKRYPHLQQAHAKAVELMGSQVSNIIEPQVNGEASFFIGPDGSKEGWQSSEDGNQRRKEFLDWMKSSCMAVHLDWIEVTFGGDGGPAKITDDCRQGPDGEIPK